MDGFRYTLTYLDNASSHGVLLYLKHTNEALTRFKEYKVWAENQTNRKLKKMHCNRGTEFLNKDFKQFLAQSGIELNISVPYSLQQNGHTKR